jgi:AcrR family transcriptional regulator
MLCLIMDANVGLRERKKERTRTQLMDAALRLFTQRGFDATTIEDIVEEVEVSPRTFFRYFDSKEDVVIGFFDQMGEGLRSMLAARPEDEPPFTAVRHALASLLDGYTADRERVCAVKRLSLETPAIRARLLDKHARWENRLTEGLAARLGVDPERDSRPRLIAAVSLAAFSTAISAWVASDGRDDPRPILERSLEAVGRGLDHVAAAPA